MFTANIPEVPYFDPWAISLAERLRTLARGKRRVAYFYEEPNNSTFRYRAYNMTQVLNDGGSLDTSACYFFLSDFDRMDEIADLADIFVICRSRYCNLINQIINKFRIRGKRVLFDIDDLVFDTKYAHLILNTLGQEAESAATWDYWFSYTSRMCETMRMCDGAITTNDYLGARITDCVGLPVKVVPNFMNREQIAISESIFRKKTESGFERDGKICLGYFSGSPSHNLDYAIISSAIEQILERDDRVEFMLVGYIEPGPELSRFTKRIHRRPFQDYVNLQRLIGSVEFNLMPLQSNVFTNCKSELKYFEAAIVGTASIASPSYTYGACIKNNENGHLSYAHEWVSVIQRAIENINKYEVMAKRAFDHSTSSYAWFRQRDVILNALGWNNE